MRNSKDQTFTWQKIASVLAIGSLLAGCNPTESIDDSAEVAIPTSTCFWKGPYVKEVDETNVAFPDTGAVYWSAKYKQPVGATLKIKGDFPHARYISINSYLPTIDDNTHPDYPGGTPRFAIADRDMVADSGSINPYLQNANRGAEYRSFTLDVIPGSAPASEADWVQNTLYEESVDDLDTVIVYRIYVPDTNTGYTGGVALPEVELTLATGEVKTGEDACAELGASPDYVKTPFVPVADYKGLVALSAYKGGVAQETPLWVNARGFVYGLMCDYLSPAAVPAYLAVQTAESPLAGVKAAFDAGSISADYVFDTYLCPTEKVRDVGYYANLDNQYLYTYVDRSHKPIVVTRGKLPNVPSTLDGNATFDLSAADMRYWSLCLTEFYSQRVSQCLYDEQVQADDLGYFTIVSSLPEDRPDNATEACGVGYLEWSAEGDGLGYLIDGETNNDTAGFMILRNMLPENGFTQTAQEIPRRGDELATMGDYMPVTTYYTKAEFEALGCNN